MERPVGALMKGTQEGREVVPEEPLRAQRGRPQRTEGRQAQALVD